MNRQNLVANLIYLILTYVQVFLWIDSANASPNLEPSITSTQELSNSPVPDELSKLDSIAISGINEKHPIVEVSAITNQLHDRISFSGGVYFGPYLDEKAKVLPVIGFDYLETIDPSIKNHYGLKLSKERNPFIFVSNENSIRNSWRSIKSWNLIFNLEVNTDQGLGAFTSLNHYMGGLGLNFFTSSRIVLSVNFYPISIRGPSGEIILSSLIF